MKFGIEKLLERIGEEQISVQFLNQCLTGATHKRRENCTEFKFVSDETINDVCHPVSPPTRTAIILWVDVGHLQDAIAELEAEPDDADSHV